LENKPKQKVISLSVVSSIFEIPQAEWDACALDSSQPESYNPFLSYGFLSSLEDTGCAVRVSEAISFILQPKEASIDVCLSYGNFYLQNVIRKQVGCHYTLLQRMNVRVFWVLFHFISKAILMANLFLIILGLMHTEVLAEDIILNFSVVFLSPQLLVLGFLSVIILAKSKFLMLLFLP